MKPSNRKAMCSVSGSSKKNVWDEPMFVTGCGQQAASIVWEDRPNNDTIYCCQACRHDTTGSTVPWFAFNPHWFQQIWLNYFITNIKTEFSYVSGTLYVVENDCKWVEKDGIRLSSLMFTNLRYNVSTYNCSVPELTYTQIIQKNPE